MKISVELKNNVHIELEDLLNSPTVQEALIDLGWTPPSVEKVEEDPEIKFNVKCSCGHIISIQNNLSVLKNTTSTYCTECGKPKKHSKEIYDLLREIS